MQTRGRGQIAETRHVRKWEDLKGIKINTSAFNCKEN